MFKKILLTTDLSENSKEAFGYAKNLATKYNAKIYLVAVIQDPAELALFSVIEQPNLILEDIQKKVFEEVKKDLDGIGKEIGYEDLEAVVLDGGGSVHSAIIKFAKENEIDLIVVASKGRTGLRRFMLGSVSEKILKESKCPVLIVPCN